MSEEKKNVPDSVAWLYQEYYRRREKNPAFSLRAFARILEISSGRMSELLSQKRRLTEAMALKIAEKLKYPPLMKQQLISIIRREYAARSKEDPTTH